MKKPLEVREYDTITGNADYQAEYKYLEEKAFRELITFIHEFSGDGEAADALDFMRISYKRNVGEVVTVKNYVGLIQFKGGNQIQILPKISFDGDEDSGNRKTKNIFLSMLRSMKDFPSKVFSDANLDADRMNLYEIFINLYLQEVRQLVRHGLKSDYVREENNLRYYKGKLLTGRHIKENAAHAERFYTAYDDFNPNRAENKIVKATLIKLRQLTESAENAKEIRQLLTFFENVEASVNHAKEFSRIKADRNTRDYETLIPWSKVFLMNKSFTTFSGTNSSRALLFPMERVYESYAAKYIKKIFGPSGWEISTQDKGHYLFTEPQRQFALRPDIVCKLGLRTVIMDTKWKNLTDNESVNYGISQADMYQMFAYSRKYNTPEIWLLYPVNPKMRNHRQISFKSINPVSEEVETVVNLHFVDLEHIEESIKELKMKLEAETDE